MSDESEQLAAAVAAVTADVAAPLMRVRRANHVPGTDGRNETTAEHSFHLALVASVALPEFPELDRGRVYEFITVHDIAEAAVGDVSVYATEEARSGKEAAEQQALRHLADAAPPLAQRVVLRAQEYQARATREALFVYALDKIVPYFLVLAGRGHHASPTLEQYLETERRAREQIATTFPPLLPLFERAAAGVRLRVSEA